MVNAAIEMSKEKAHKILGHAINEATIKITIKLGYKLAGCSSI